MLEPVQNCFTFYRPDGKSSAHIYGEQETLLDDKDSHLPPEEFNVEQQLALFDARNTKNNLMVTVQKPP